MRVLEDHVKRDVLGQFGRERLGLGLDHAQALAAAQLVLGFASRTIDEDVAVAQPALQSRARMVGE